jgi:hypothetical protein
MRRKKLTLSFTKNLLDDCFGDQSIPEANSCQYLEIILRSDLSWADQVNYTVGKAWKARNFMVRVLIKESSNTKSWTLTSLVRPFVDYGASCWDPYRECQINASDSVQRKAAKFANHTNDSVWETLVQRRKIAHICVFLKLYAWERTWKVIGDRLKEPCHLSRDDNDLKLGSGNKENWTIKQWYQLPAEVLATTHCKLYIF